MVDGSEGTSVAAVEPEVRPRVGTFAAFASPAFRPYWASTSAYFLVQGGSLRLRASSYAREPGTTPRTAVSTL